MKCAYNAADILWIGWNIMHIQCSCQASKHTFCSNVETFNKYELLKSCFSDFPKRFCIYLHFCCRAPCYEKGFHQPFATCLLQQRQVKSIWTCVEDYWPVLKVTESFNKVTRTELQSSLGVRHVFETFITLTVVIHPPYTALLSTHTYSPAHPHTYSASLSLFVQGDFLWIVLT